MNEEILVKRNVRDSVFTHLFQNRQYVLQLFKALHPEARDVTEDMIEIVTLENVLVDNIYNDLGFMVGEQLVVLVEAQSTWTANIIVRALMYMAQTYHDYIGKKELNLYGSKRIAIPKPELYMIYTGDRAVRQDVISLSEEFFGGEQTDLDVRVHVLTDGKQGDIINQYITFTRILNEQINQHGRTYQAVLETIRICKDRNVLAGYLAEHEQEVQNIMVSLFDNNQIVKAYTKEKVEEGRKEGENQKAIEVAKKMLMKAMPVDLISELSGLSTSEVDALKARIAT